MNGTNILSPYSWNILDDPGFNHLTMQLNHLECIASATGALTFMTSLVFIGEEITDVSISCSTGNVYARKGTTVIVQCPQLSSVLI